MCRQESHKWKFSGEIAEKLGVHLQVAQHSTNALL